MFTRVTAQLAALAGLVGLSVGLAGCSSKVNQEEFNNEVAKLREEIQTGDRANAGRIDSLGSTLSERDTRLTNLEQELQTFRNEYQVSIQKAKDLLKFDVPVHFDFDQSDVREADRPVLYRFAHVVSGYYPGAVITVEGFADPAGSDSYNQALGKRRADAVREYLTTIGGLPTDNFRVVSYGELANRLVKPGEQGPGDRGIENRRVTLVIEHAAVETDQVATQ